MSMRDLTYAEGKILRAIKESMPLPPTLRELCVRAGVSSTSVVNYHLDKLVIKGYIERLPKVSRGILLKQKDK